ncbi:18769_t:CDS:2 [Dentiscutata erythropus]|uniref:18768_t:CDS:1 n=1 Tax=Dentiscutata erythropus TaxID=1348616 RepID=A0A9N8VS11_9GLOM|nr:18768_t:CDS:2 [Dentiscutata erythropus]CAG8464403.1 18769_t:CDS:2 [Dentiscutata erythropus]
MTQLLTWSNALSEFSTSTPTCTAKAYSLAIHTQELQNHTLINSNITTTCRIRMTVISSIPKR